jgi:putative nucleotidyltransferase with HDIG domain
MKGRIIGREGRNIRALEHATGVDLIIDDTPDAVMLSSFDGVRREVARLALTRLMSDGRIHPTRIEEIVEKSRADVENELKMAGEEAMIEANCPGLHPELIRTLGRLKYRTSYGQNQLMHAVESSKIAALLAREIGADINVLRRGALLHDIGKMGVPDAILSKPGPLSKKERELMERHPSMAYDMLLPITFLREALDIPYCHHEKWDGRGYPQGLKGEEIPIEARIFAVVDVWDALRSNRPYRKRWSEQRVRKHLREQAGRDFDPRIVEVFLSLENV